MKLQTTGTNWPATSHTWKVFIRVQLEDRLKVQEYCVTCTHLSTQIGLTKSRCQPTLQKAGSKGYRQA